MHDESRGVDRQLCHNVPKIYKHTASIRCHNVPKIYKHTAGIRPALQNFVVQHQLQNSFKLCVEIA